MRILLSIVILLGLFQSIINAQWIKLNSGTKEQLTDVVMFDSVTAIAVGRGRSILRTTDAGKTWDNRTIMLSSVMPWNGVAFSDSLNGVVVGDHQVRFTSDGGKLWYVNTPPFNRKFLSALNLPGGGLFVGADSGWIYSSSDTGKTWYSEKINDEDIRSLFIWRGAIASRLPVYALTPFSLYETSFNEDGSQDPWTKITIPISGLGSEVFDGEFGLGGGAGFIVGVQGDFWSEPKIIRTQDTGWIPVNIDNLESGVLHGISAPSENFVYACGTGGMIFKSPDKGDSWQRSEVPTNQNLNAISFYNNLIGMAVGDSGVILYTNNGGQTPEENGPLQPCGLQDKVITSLATEELDNNQFNLPAFNFLFAGSDKEGVFRTIPFNNSGEWEPIGLKDKYIDALTVRRWGFGPSDGLRLFASVNPYFEDKDSVLIFSRETFLSYDTIWVASDSGIIRDNISINALNAFYFSGHTPPGNIIAGSNSGIYTSLLGNFWTESNPSGNINSIDVYPHWFGNLCWAVGNYGLGPAAFKSTDRGETWKGYYIPHPLDVGVTSVCINTRFPDSVYFAVNGSIYVTPDSGATFNEIFSDTYGSIRVIALDPLKPDNIFAAGSLSGNSLYFITSKDGGKSWDVVFPNMLPIYIAEATSIAVSNNVSNNKCYIFIGTSGTGVWRYSSPSVTNVDEEENIPQGFHLFQNYPNPFNPTTVISYQLPVTSNVELKIYDLLGREVITLVNEEKLAGSYKIEWNAKNFSSGIYFYVLNAGGNILSQKMSLIK